MSRLRIFVAERIIRQGFDIDSMPVEILQEVSNVDVIFNHAILLAELWEVEHADALVSINQVYQFARGGSAPFVKEDFEDLLPVLKSILPRLSNLLDADGRILPGNSIPDARFFEIDSSNRLFFISHRLAAFDFCDAVKRIIDIFDFALGKGLSVDYISE